MGTKSTDEQMSALTRACVDVVSREDLAARLGEGRPLKVKLGIDPSGPMLHLGHAVVLRQLRAALADGRLYARDLTRLVCLDVAGR